jgi:DNA-binding NarL/FixJ family response regulator
MSVLNLGARGVILKQAAQDSLLEAIRTVTQGNYWLPQERIQDIVQIFQSLATSGKSKPATKFGLTLRELEVVRAVAEGCTNRDIAHKLSISEDTVKRHLTNIFDKVGVSSRVELALFALNHQLTGE